MLLALILEANAKRWDPHIEVLPTQPARGSVRDHFEIREGCADLMEEVRFGNPSLTDEGNPRGSTHFVLCPPHEVRTQRDDGGGLFETVVPEGDLLRGLVASRRTDEDLVRHGR